MSDFDKDVKAGDELAIVICEMYNPVDVAKIRTESLGEKSLRIITERAETKVTVTKVTPKKIYIDVPDRSSLRVINKEDFGSPHMGIFAQVIYVKNTPEEKEKAVEVLSKMLFDSLVKTIEDIESKLPILTNHLQKIEMKKHES